MSEPTQKHREMAERINGICLSQTGLALTLANEQKVAQLLADAQAEDNSAAQKELGELRKDKERLDWLDDHMHPNCLSSANETTFLVTYWGVPEISASRLAIEAAMNHAAIQKAT